MLFKVATKMQCKEGQLSQTELSEKQKDFRDFVGATARGILRVKLLELHFIKMLSLDVSSYCKATNTCSMDLI